MRVSNLSLAIGIPLTFPFVPSGFFYSFAHMERPTYTLIHADNGPIDTLRNDLVDKAMEIGATHLIMMDTDQLYPVNTIPRLLSHKLPVVGCMVHRRYPPFDPIMFCGRPGEYTPADGWEPGDLVEVDATGSGCLMFDMQVFRKMPRPWFKFRKLSDFKELHGVEDEGVGEDIGFSADLRDAGYKIYVDTSLECGHLTTLCVNRHTHQLYKSMKEKQHREALGKALQGEVVNI